MSPGGSLVLCRGNRGATGWENSEVEASASPNKTWGARCPPEAFPEAERFRPGAGVGVGGGSHVDPRLSLPKGAADPGKDTGLE